MLSCNFNQNKTLFSIGTESGFRIYKLTYNSISNNKKLEIDYYEKKLDGGLSIVEMYYDSNILILVGGGKYPIFPKNKVILWDEETSMVISEISFSTLIQNLKVKKDLLFVATEVRIHVINLLSLQVFDRLELDSTSLTVKGLMSINYTLKETILAFPDKNTGFVRIKNYDTQNEILLKAHKSEISFLQLSDDGKLLATASHKKKSIRIFRTIDGRLLAKYSTTTQESLVNYFSFDFKKNYLSVDYSDGSVGVYSLETVLKNNHSIHVESKFLQNTNNKFSSFKSKEFIVDNTEYETNKSSKNFIYNEECYSVFNDQVS